MVWVRWVEGSRVNEREGSRGCREEEWLFGWLAGWQAGRRVNQLLVAIFESLKYD